MADSTYEEARRCPRCQQPGVEVGNRSGPHGSRLHTIQCRTPRCRWFNTDYVVQVNSDGSIPDPTLERPKHFPKLPNRSDEEVNAMLDRLYNDTVTKGR